MKSKSDFVLLLIGGPTHKISGAVLGRSGVPRACALQLITLSIEFGFSVDIILSNFIPINRGLGDLRANRPDTVRYL